MKSNTIKRGSLETVYRVVEDAGADSGVLVCAGGLGGTHLVWSKMIRVLRKRYRILVVDYPGLGAGESLSSETALNIEDLVALFGEVLEREGVEEACFVGWSLGSQITFECARQFPEKISGIVAVCGLAGKPFGDQVPTMEKGRSFPPPGAWTGAMGFLAGQIDRIDALKTMLARLEHPTRWAKRLNLIDPAVDDLVFDTIIKDFLALDGVTYGRYIEMAAAHDASEVLPSLAMPVLAVAGERDRFVRKEKVEAMIKSVPGGEIFVARGATHFLPVEYGDLLAYKIESFLDDNEFGKNSHEP